MRLAMFSCVAVALFMAGCASCIARCGCDPGKILTREQVRQTLGEPIASGGTSEEPYEEFHCHRKIAENLRGTVLWLAAVYTLGLADLYYVPCEVVHFGEKTIAGWNVRIYYDATGKVTKYAIDGLPGMDWPLDENAKLPGMPASPLPSTN
jgi:hypothetical protein